LRNIKEQTDEEFSSYYEDLSD